MFSFEPTDSANHTSSHSVDNVAAIPLASRNPADYRNDVLAKLMVLNPLGNVASHNL